MSRTAHFVSDFKLVTHFEDDEPVHTFEEVQDGRRLVTWQERWAREKYLGKGGFGSVWLERCSHGRCQGELRAVKMVHKRHSSSRKIDYSRELEAVTKFSHRNYEATFVKSFGWYETDEAIFIAMEYLPKGDLHLYLSQRRQSLPQPEAQQVTRQILEGLNHMHSNNFAHRDVTPKNILIKAHPPDRWWVKLADFGISKHAEDENVEPSTIKGTSGFMAPELQGFRQRAQRDTPTDFQAADMWSLGEITFRILTGKRAFSDQQDFALYCLNKSPGPSLVLSPSLPEDTTGFVAGLLTVDSQLRLKASQALTHPWMQTPKVDTERDLQTSIDIQTPSATANVAESPDEPKNDHLSEPSKSWSAISDRGYSRSTDHDKPKSADTMISSKQAQTRQPVASDHQPSPAVSQSKSSSTIDRNNLETQGQTTDREDWPLRTDERHAAMPLHSGPMDQSAMVKIAEHAQFRQASTLQSSMTRISPKSPRFHLRFTLERGLQFRGFCDGHTEMVRAVAISPDGKVFASASWDRTTKVWDTSTGDLLQTISDSRGGSAVTFSPIHYVLAVARGSFLVLHKYSKPMETCILQGHTATIRSVVFSPNGGFIASAGDDKTIIIWSFDGATGTAVKALRGHTQGVRSVAFSPDGKTIASAALDGSIKLWEVEGHSVTTQQTLTLHTQQARTVVFSPDGRLIVSAHDSFITLWSWDGRFGRWLQTSTGDATNIYALSFISNGETFASAGGGRTITLWAWDGRSASAYQTLMGHKDTVRDIVFSPDGRTLVSASHDKTVRVWRQ